MIIEEVVKLGQHLEQRLDEPIQFSGTYNASIINALWSIITGQKFDLDDPAFHKLVSELNKVVRNASPLSPVAAILPHPSMAKWPILDKLSGYKAFKQTMGHAYQILMPHYEEHKKTLARDNARDFLDLMLQELENASVPESPFYGTLGDFTVLNTMMDLFFAGMETTSSSLVNLFLQILHHPDVQEKVHQELDIVVGRNRSPRLHDQAELHYTNAVLLESLRVSSLAYNGLPRCATQDMVIGPYKIPKGTIVMAFLYNIHHDPKVFKDPKTFNPSRFIDESGKFSPSERVIPFGIGKRVCLGQSLAEKQFFLFFTNLMQRFEFRPEPGTSLPSYQEIYPRSLLRNVQPYNAVLRKRFL